MFSGEEEAHAFNIFKWKSSGKSTLTTGLLDGVPPEIELSSYHIAPSPQSESPSEFLDVEALIGKPINDLDLFFERIYSYYCNKGLWCIIIKWIVELLSLAFTICFSGFFLLYVDWHGLRNAKCGMDAVESGIRPCDLYEEALHHHPLTPFTLSKAVIVGYLAIFTIYWIFCFLRFFAQLKDTLKIRHFYLKSLRVTDNELQTMPWELILEKVVLVQSVQQLCAVKDLSIHDVVMRLMRKENYLIGMLNKGVLAFPILGWIPGAGPVTKVGPDGVQYRLVLPKTLEWILNWCILQSMFNRNYHIRRDFVSDPETLKKMLRVVGFALILLSPFLVIFMLVYLFLRHAEQFYNHPSIASSRGWSNLSRWMLREFNEVEHLFKHRMNSSVEHASNYLKQFPSPILTIVAKFISFVSGGFAAVLIIIAFLEESLLEGHIFGRNLLWYAAVFGTITAISRAAVADELLVLDPQGTMSRVVEHTHYMPKRWRGKENTKSVQTEFETLFQYTGVMLLEEMASIFLTPYLLLFVVPKQVDGILQFIVDFTVDVEGVGHVCSFSNFDFKNHGNQRYGSPFCAPRNQRSSQGKMEKSFLSFKIAYPSWEPSAEGMQFLSLLKAFRDQMLQGHRVTDAQQSGWKEAPLFNLGHLHQFGPLWPMDVEHKNLQYIIDWHYTSHDHDHGSRDFPVNNEEEIPKDLWTPSLPQNIPIYDDNWDSPFSSRVQNPLEASTSAPIFQASVLRHHESVNIHQAHPSHDRWWARAPIQGTNLPTSFLEPPNFVCHDSSGDFHDTYSDMSGIEEEQQLHRSIPGGLSRTFYIDNLDTGDNDLPFDDIYGQPPGDSLEDGDPENLV